jgi:transcriptional regulator with XRE-family HTH domain/quercetin dioxygenase-like cupin family protein
LIQVAGRSPAARRCDEFSIRPRSHTLNIVGACHLPDRAVTVSRGAFVTARSGSPAASRAPRRRAAAGADGVAEVPVPADRRDAVTSVGAKLRERRVAAGLSLRQFARNLGVSPSLVSQIENGKSQPSVATLYMICSQLDLSIDELFSNTGVAEEPVADAAVAGADGVGAAPGLDLVEPAGDTHTFRGALAKLSEPDEHEHRSNPVVAPAQRRRLVLDSGVTWEQLSAHQATVDFLLVTYQVGGSSVPDERLTRHSGIEYGYIISGTLEIALGFETYQVSAGESISFDSSTPHRLTNRGDVPVEAIWFVHGRNPTHEH